MTSEVSAKLQTNVRENITKMAKKVNIAARDFNSEVSKQTSATNTPRSKENAVKQEKDVKASDKPQTKSEDASSGKVLDKAEKNEQPIEKIETVASMQLQQIAMNIATVESKDDIPKIVLPEAVQEVANVNENLTDAPQKANVEKANGGIKIAELNSALPQEMKSEVQEAKAGEVKPEIEKSEVTKAEFKISSKNVKDIKPEVKDSPKEEIGEQFEFAKVVPEAKLDFNKVNIKVADAPIRAEAPDMPQQLVDKITYNADQGKHVFDIELFPENLGKVAIKMVFEKGVAELVMTTHTDKAHKLLSQQLDVIRGILETNTQNQASVEVKAGENASENFDKDSFLGQGEKNQQEQQKDRKEDSSDSFLEKLRLGIAEQSI
jgi:hypothetical protein